MAMMPARRAKLAAFGLILLQKNRDSASEIDCRGAKNHKNYRESRVGAKFDFTADAALVPRAMIDNALNLK